MSDQNHSGEREIVFCHGCEDEWHRDEHGLICPQCASEAVEIIEHDSDPRANHDLPDETPEGHPFSDPSHPMHHFHHHNPWAHHQQDGGDDSDPDEGDIRHVEWTGPGGMRISSTTYSNVNGTQSFRSGGGPGPPMGFDAFAPMLQSLLGQGGVLNSAFQQGTGAERSGEHREDTDHRSPLQEGPWSMPGPGPGIRGMTFRSSNYGGTTTNNFPAHDDIGGIFGTLLQSIMPPGEGGGPGHRFPFGDIAFLNPANASMGDAVYSNEALDRVISQLMEQHSSSTAPGPASEAAIAALPKITITKEHLDDNNKAECSICMEAAELGSEVTELPCKHWFHEECVSEWLHQHDTCPQCRRGITPRDGDEHTVRQTGQQPRHWQLPADQLRRTLSSDNSRTQGFTGSGTASSPINVPDSPPGQRPHSQSGSRSDNNRSSGSGILGWMGRLRHGSHGNGGGNGDNNSAH